MRAGEFCSVRSATYPWGQYRFLRELPLSGLWSRYRGTHLPRQATEERKIRTAVAVSPHNTQVMDSRETLRREGRRRRATVAAGDSGARLAARFLSSIPYRAHETVSGYWPVGREMDDRPLLHALRVEGLTVALPTVVAEGSALQFRAWDGAEELAPGPYGIPAPPVSGRLLRPTLVIVPLVLFDAIGHRLGSGKGFYDRTLAELRGVSTILAVGVAFAAQRIEALPALPTDQRLDAVVTEAGIEWF